MVPKIAELKSMIDKCGRDVLIEVDGGISPDNAQLVYSAGAEVLVAGSSVFKAEDYKKAIDELLDACKN